MDWWPVQCVPCLSAVDWWRLCQSLMSLKNIKVYRKWIDRYLFTLSKQMYKPLLFKSNIPDSSKVKYLELSFYPTFDYMKFYIVLLKNAARLLWWHIHEPIKTLGIHHDNIYDILIIIFGGRVISLFNTTCNITHKVILANLIKHWGHAFLMNYCPECLLYSCTFYFLFFAWTI